MNSRLCAKVAFGAALALILAASVSRAQEYSHARIVRLSFVEGTVTVQRPGMSEWAAAWANTPLQEGFKVSTAEGGFAEIEFENASTARIGQLTLIEFTQLVLKPSGGKINRLRLHEGYATFNFLPEQDDFYEVTAGDATLAPRGKTRFRLDLEEGLLVVKVFKGSVEISSPDGTGTVGENAMLTLRPGTEDPLLIAQGFERDAWDEWVEQREGQVELVRRRAAPSIYSNNVTDLLYGWSDLNWYGNWTFLPGYGHGWVPTVGFGWRPFLYGRWGWYPGFGYTWISFEPWGWLPYHYGYWTYYPGIGWCWIPSGFSTWSPGVVDWYQGPGWVGWGPRRHPRPRGDTFDPCGQAQGCTVVSEDTFREGRPIRVGEVLGIHPRQGRPVERPDITPTGLAHLPGSPLSQGASFGSFGRGRHPARVPTTDELLSGAAGTAGGTATTPAPPITPGAPSAVQPGRGVTSPTGGIVFDPDERRYVNAPVREPGETATSETLTGRFGRGPQAIPGGAAAPSATSVPVQAGPAGRPGPQGGIAVAPAGTPERGESSRRSKGWSPSGVFRGSDSPHGRGAAGPRSESGGDSGGASSPPSASSRSESSTGRWESAPSSRSEGSSISRPPSSGGFGGGRSSGGGHSGGVSSGGSGRGGRVSAPSGPPASAGRPPR